MIYLKDDEIIKENTACALGLFDGVHRGHQLVIAKACDHKNQGLRSAVYHVAGEHRLCGEPGDEVLMPMRASV